MLRRTFLFLTGIALARVAADYFAIAQNRDSFLTLAGQLWQKSLAFLSRIQSNQTPQPLPNNPIVKSAKTNQPLPSNPIVKSPESSPARSRLNLKLSNVLLSKQNPYNPRSRLNLKLSNVLLSKQNPYNWAAKM
jgi:hypothetical protein